MKISSRLSFAAYVPALLALVVILTLVISYLDLQKLQDNGDKVRQIRSGITDVNHVIFSYILYHQEQPKEQFQADQLNIAQLIGGVDLSNPDQQHLLDNIRMDNQDMSDYFGQLVAVYETSAAAGTATDSGAESRLVGLVLSRSYAADSDASLLRSLTDKDIRGGIMRTGLLIIFVLLVAAIPTTIILVRTRRSITSSLSVLGKGAAVIGSGNLDYVIPDKDPDELGDLSRAFNRMATDLKTVTASKTDLEREIAERKRTETALRESEERFLKAFHANPVAQTIATLPDGRWVEVNDSFLRLLEYSRDEVIGHTSAELNMLHSTVRAQTLQEFQEQGSVQNSELIVRTRTGKLLTVLSSNEKITLNGQLHSISTIIDITERKRAEEAIERYASELEDANRDLATANQELESFSYSVSHDLRTPLRSLDGYSQALLEDYTDKLDEQGRKWLENIRSSSQHMGRLIDDILGLSRVIRTELKIDKVDLSQAAESVVANLKESDPGRQVEFSILPGLQTSGDKNLLNLVLQNLLGNAFKFTAGRPHALIQFGVVQQDGTRVYFVKDNGVGFNMQYVDKLFKPFQRLHSSRDYPGTGIGLVTVQRIVQRHGGKIWTEGTENVGATFYFTLGQEKN